MVERKYVLTRFSVEKVLCADEVVSGRVAAINSSVYKTYSEIVQLYLELAHSK